MYVKSIFLLLAALVAAAPSGSPSRTEVDAALYDELVRYAGYPLLSSDGNCSHPSIPGSIYKFVENKHTDTQVSIWRVDERQEFVVAIPGTNSVLDILHDLTIPLVPYFTLNVSCPDLCLVHLGFLDAWNSVARFVTQALGAALEAHPNYTVTLTGYSLGGAIASLAYGTLRNGPYNLTRAYTYGAPRAGNRGFARFLNDLNGNKDGNPGDFYRVTHGTDIVPTLPPIWFWYEHGGTEYWESKPGMDNDASSSYHCYGNEPVDCINSEPKHSFDDHNSYPGFNVTCSASSN
ncbi:Lipase, class 3 [Akanthomyces lecanii RCEF 1005]|uniref:Lipase, class 3 n=1 Tax=Akanthomyces lecanii RCEF 1005 TaxID=1081108 RepID=A0A167NZR8_CORDF|nr:Lipase, class 3 [Akanthomyces lecanii RCEF 1005]